MKSIPPRSRAAQATRRAASPLYPGAARIEKTLAQILDAQAVEEIERADSLDREREFVLQLLALDGAIQKAIEAGLRPEDFQNVGPRLYYAVLVKAWMKKVEARAAA